MESLGYLNVVPTRNTSPLFPKVYYATGKGVRKLRQAYAAQGKTWEPSRVDRKGRHSKEGYSADQVIHEILLTEFLLAVWQTVQGRPDLELLTIQRRALAKHAAFQITVGGRATQLKPDALFLFRQRDRGMLVCCIEMDTGSMNRKQLRAKFNRYQTFAESEDGKQYLLDLYRRHGATDPRPSFRLLVIAKDTDKMASLHRGLHALAPGVWSPPVYLTTTMDAPTSFIFISHSGSRLCFSKSVSGSAAICTLFR
jgi:hypothetical protein